MLTDDQQSVWVKLNKQHCDRTTEFNAACGVRNSSSQLPVTCCVGMGVSDQLCATSFGRKVSGAKPLQLSILYSLLTPKQNKIHIL